MTIHLALVSDQVLANLIPALMERPALVVLACSRAMAGRGLDGRLKAALGRAGIPVRLWPQPAPDAGLRQIQEFALEIAAGLTAEHPGAELVLNATGGTKLMALGFVEVFRGIASRILYTDTAHGRIEVLPDAAGHVPAAVPMTDVLDVPSYLAAQGFRFQRARSDDADWQARAAGRKAACKHLGRGIADPTLQPLIGTLNWHADQALERIPGTWDERLIAPERTLDRPPRGPWADAFGALAAAGLIDWQPGAARFRLIDADAAHFIRGGWLEEYAYHALGDAGAFDVRLGVEGVWQDAGRGGDAAPNNELDVLACHVNQLLFVEAKTLRFRDGNDNELAYKLDSLGQDARGLFGETWLLSARAPTELLMERARQARIRIIGPAELGGLRDLVRTWLASRRADPA